MEQLLKHFKRFYMSHFVKPAKYGLIKVVIFTKDYLKSWLQDKDIKAYSTHNEWKSVVAECFIRTVKFTDK